MVFWIQWSTTCKKHTCALLALMPFARTQLF
uniref:Uncharacterized protein n=1 Tax=Anguilla anguilla TaxID=7936 RepID=A0A0E9PV34_ANGAN